MIVNRGFQKLDAELAPGSFRDFRFAQMHDILGIAERFDQDGSHLLSPGYDFRRTVLRLGFREGA